MSGQRGERDNPGQFEERPPREDVLARGLAEDLLLLCWDAEQGIPHRHCWKTVDLGVAGGLVADGLLAGALAIDGGRLRSHDPPPDDPLLAKVAASIDRRVRPPRVRTVVEQLARPRIRAEVRDRLVARSVLAPQRRRVLGVVPTTRFPVADADTAAAVRHEVASLATAAHDPGELTERQQLLVALAGAVTALDLLVDGPQRAAARERAAAMTPHDELISAVDAAADEVQAFLATGVG